MTIQTALLKGHFHPVYCEDFLLTEQLSPDLHLIAVMDGCSMGDDSHFASALVGKILKKQVKTLSWEEFAGKLPAFSDIRLEELGKSVLSGLFDDLRKSTDLLLLDRKELLSTLVMALLRPSASEAWAVVIGDGYIATEDDLIDIDQQNKPDYLAYHLNEDFETWYSSHDQFFSFSNIQQLVVSTDGPGAIRKMEPQKPDYEGDMLRYLFLDPEFADVPRGMYKKLELLEQRHGLVATDDIAMVKIRL
ncbi:MAG: protein phosphatase 2C domain-containing protein [Bacteroidia bacterium]